ncbi:hypothetical protein [Phycicoccus ginsengisoli]
MEPTDDTALEEFLLRVQELGQDHAPAPNARLAAVLGTPAPARVRRIAPRTVAGATALGIATLVGTGWAAAAADQLPAPAQRAVARLTAGWLPGIPHPEDRRPGAGTTPSAVLPTPTTATVPVPAGDDPTGDVGTQPVRQSVAPARPTGTGGDDAERPGGEDGDGSAVTDRGGEAEEPRAPRPATGTATGEGRDDDNGTQTGSSAGAGDATTDGYDDGGATGSDDGHDGSGRGSTGDGADR